MEERRDPDDVVYDEGGLLILARELTCFDCECRDECLYVDDAYNTDGDCIASK